MTYPSTNPNIPVGVDGASGTDLNKANWDPLVNNINPIGSDLVTARGSAKQDFPIGSHTAATFTNIDELLRAMKHMLGDINKRLGNPTAVPTESAYTWYTDIEGNNHGLRIKVKNSSGTIPLPVGTLVKVDGFDSSSVNLPLVSKAQANDPKNLAAFIVVDAQIDAAGTGFASTISVLTRDTTGKVVGTPVYLHPTDAGTTDLVDPITNRQTVGRVIVDGNATTGKVFVNLNAMREDGSGATSTFNSITVAPTSDILASKFTAFAGMVNKLSAWTIPSGVATISAQRRSRTVGVSTFDYIESDYSYPAVASASNMNIPSSYLNLISSGYVASIAQDRAISFHVTPNNSLSTTDFYNLHFKDNNLLNRLSLELSDATLEDRLTTLTISSIQSNAIVRFPIYTSSAQSVLVSAKYFDVAALYNAGSPLFRIRVKNADGTDNITAPLELAMSGIFTFNQDIVFASVSNLADPGSGNPEDFNLSGKIMFKGTNAAGNPYSISSWKNSLDAITLRARIRNRTILNHATKDVVDFELKYVEKADKALSGAVADNVPSAYLSFIASSHRQGDAVGASFERKTILRGFTSNSGNADDFYGISLRDNGDNPRIVFLLSDTTSATDKKTLLDLRSVFAGVNNAQNGVNLRFFQYSDAAQTAVIGNKYFDFSYVVGLDGAAALNAQKFAFRVKNSTDGSDYALPILIDFFPADSISFNFRTIFAVPAAGAIKAPIEINGITAAADVGTVPASSLRIYFDGTNLKAKLADGTTKTFTWT